MQQQTAVPRTAERDARPIAAVLAVKGLADAKSRLSPVVPADGRRALVVAMMIDTITAAQSAGVDHIVVVTPDPEVRSAAHDIGARVVGDAEAPETDSSMSSLNRAFLRGIETAVAAVPRTRVVVLQADLPALRADHLAVAIDRTDGYAQAMIPDRSGAGTAMLMLADIANATPRFGVDSANAHRAAGAVDLTAGSDDAWPDLRTDVDTVDDLAAAMALGVGRRTAQALADIGLDSLGSMPAPHAS